MTLTLLLVSSAFRMEGDARVMWQGLSQRETRLLEDGKPRAGTITHMVTLALAGLCKKLSCGPCSLSA